MKLLLLFSLSTLAASFSPAPVLTLRKATSLSMVTTMPGPGPHMRTPAKDDWSDKPIPRRRTTKPVPARVVSTRTKRAMADAVVSPNFYLAWAFAILGAVILWYHPAAADGSPSVIGIAGGSFHILFAALLWVQTSRVRLVCEKDSFEFYNVKGPGLDLEKDAWLERKPANYVSGTRNRWRYDKIINYGFFPSIEYPVIVYFKETETPKKQWNKWFAAFDSYGNGQPHFFPGICDAREFKEQMELRGVKRKPIPTMKKRG